MSDRRKAWAETCQIAAALTFVIGITAVAVEHYTAMAEDLERQQRDLRQYAFEMRELSNRVEALIQSQNRTNQLLEAWLKAQPQGVAK